MAQEQSWRRGDALDLPRVSGSEGGGGGGIRRIWPIDEQGLQCEQVGRLWGVWGHFQYRLFLIQISQFLPTITPLPLSGHPAGVVGPQVYTWVNKPAKSGALFYSEPIAVIYLFESLSPRLIRTHIYARI